MARISQLTQFLKSTLEEQNSTSIIDNTDDSWLQWENPTELPWPQKLEAAQKPTVCGRHWRKNTSSNHIKKSIQKLSEVVATKAGRGTKAANKESKDTV
jgi:hypothetical protein